MIVLDTNVVSEALRERPNENVLAWLDRQEPSETCVTAITAAELLVGAERLPDGQRRDLLLQMIHRILDVGYHGRIEPFDQAAAYEYATIRARRERDGRPIGIADAQIAAICTALGTGLATRNTKDFEGLGILLIDPWDPSAA